MITVDVIPYLHNVVSIGIGDISILCYDGVQNFLWPTSYGNYPTIMTMVLYSTITLLVGIAPTLLGVKLLSSNGISKNSNKDFLS